MTSKRTRPPLPRGASITAPLLALAFALLLAPPAHAQQLQGVVRDAVSGVPVPGAVVQAIDAAGTGGSRVVSDEMGRFSIAVPVGPASLRVIRIGFHPRDLPLGTSALARAAPVEVRLQSLPALLTGVRVSDRAICPGSEDRSGALALWEQARAGLLAAVVVRQTKPGRMDVLSYVTDEDPHSRLVLRQTSSRANGSTGRPFVAVNEAVGFAQHGYMRSDASGLTFYAPDADVLLDQDFARTHCFGVTRDDKGHAGQVGLTFEPAPGDRPEGFVDVRGTLWLDSDHPALRTLAFTYTGLDRVYLDAGTGGALSFRNVPNGLVYVDQWNMLLPAVEATSAPSPGLPGSRFPGGAAPGADIRRAHVVQLRQVGGTVLSAAWPDGTHAETRVGTVIGSVRDADGNPVPGASVRLAGTQTGATTDVAGRYELSPVVPGRYGLDVVDSAYAAFTDPRQASRTIQVSPDTLDVPPMHVPSRRGALEHLCGGDASLNTQAIVLLGRVTSAQGSLGPGVRIHVRFPLSGVLDVRAERPDSSVVTPGDDGRFIVCNAPRGQTMLLRLVRNDSLLGDTSFTSARWPAQFVEWRVKK